MFDTTLFSDIATYGKMLVSTTTPYGATSLHVLHGRGDVISSPLGTLDEARIIKQMQKLFEASAAADAAREVSNNLLYSILEKYGIDRAIWTDSIYYPWSLIKSRPARDGDVPVIGFGVQFGNGSLYEYCFNPEVEDLLRQQDIKLDPNVFGEFFEAVRKHLLCCLVVGTQGYVEDVNLTLPITKAQHLTTGRTYV